MHHTPLHSYDDLPDFSWPSYIGYCLGVCAVALIVGMIWGIL